MMIPQFSTPTHQDLTVIQVYNQSTQPQYLKKMYSAWYLIESTETRWMQQNVHFISFNVKRNFGFKEIDVQLNSWRCSIFAEQTQFHRIFAVIKWLKPNQLMTLTNIINMLNKEKGISIACNSTLDIGSQRGCFFF